MVRVFRGHLFNCIMKLVRVTAVPDQLAALSLDCFDDFDTLLVLFSCLCVILFFLDQVLHQICLLDVLKGASLLN